MRDRLPYGTGTAFKILKSVIDPGLDGDLYADKPHLYGCALSSLNVLWVGGKPENGILQKVDNRGDDVVEEGGEGEGIEWRKEREVPEQAGKRKSWFLGKGRPTTWVWEAGREYRADFFNPYLDFNGIWLHPLLPTYQFRTSFTTSLAEAWCRFCSQASRLLIISPGVPWW